MYQNIITSQNNFLAADFNTFMENIDIEEAIKNFYKNMKVFHNYSIANKWLLHIQFMDRIKNPKYVAGYKTWQNLGRQVKRGEKGLMIFQPIIKIDPDSKEDQLKGFRRGTVFELSQTEGDELQSILIDIPDEFDVTSLLKKIQDHSGFEFKTQQLDLLEFSVLLDNDNTLIYQNGISKSQKVLETIKGIASKKFFSTNSLENEFIIELIGISTCNRIGIDTNSYSFSKLHFLRGEETVSEICKYFSLAEQYSELLSDEINLDSIW